MFLSVQDLELRKVRFDTTFAPGQIDLLEGLRQKGPLHAVGSAELVNSLGEIRVEGHVEGTLTGDCDRCLEPVVVPVDCRFDLLYRPDFENESGEEIEIDEEESEVGFYEGAGLELAEIVREQVLLSLPARRLCSAGCKGLCAVCGQNRNIKECQCQPSLADERWAALKSLSTGD